MNIFITYDYELFFGQPTGTVENCIIRPTNEIRDIAKRTGAKFVFFIDTGYLKQLEIFKDQFPQVQYEYELVKSQIETLVTEGHDCQLHIHPHWEDTVHNGKEWVMHTDRYKLVDFSDEEIMQIVQSYHEILERWTGKAVKAYRAGGWCLQPFNRIEPAFKAVNMKIDSTVFPGGLFTAGNYYYNFTKAPQLSKWRFQDELCNPQEDGEFWQYPISSYKYSPLFFWRLFALGRLKPKHHKPMGDGYPMSSPGLRKKMLTKGMLLSGSVDGYFVTKMDQILKKHQKQGFEDTVFIGHPKACTKFALKKLEQFIQKHQHKNQFITFSEILKG
jgi:peptidoglycan/xylan/chitin deacetylase (PgdA/CDA1 family)